jgi:hypothetical protein
MTTDDAARAEAWADYAQTADDSMEPEFDAFMAGYFAALRAWPETARDRSALVQRFFLCRSRIVSLLTDMDECFQAAAPAPAEARSEPAGDRVEQLIERIVTEIAELPDRTSPDDWPEAMLVTGEELTTILRHHLADAGAPTRHAPEPVGDRVEAACRELHEWWDNPNVPDSVRVQPRRDVSRALAAADALAPPPVVPDEVRRAFDEYKDGNYLASYQDHYRRLFEDAASDWVRTLLSAPAQPAEDGTKVAARFVLRGLREALSSASEYADGLADHIERGSAPAQPALCPNCKGEGYTEYMITCSECKGSKVAPAQPAEDARDRRIRDLEEALRNVLAIAQIALSERILNNKHFDAVNHARKLLEEAGHD